MEKFYKHLTLVDYSDLKQKYIAYHHAEQDKISNKFLEKVNKLRHKNITYGWHYSITDEPTWESASKNDWFLQSCELYSNLNEFFDEIKANNELQRIDLINYLLVIKPQTYSELQSNFIKICKEYENIKNKPLFQAENDKDNIKLFEKEVLSYYRKINWNEEDKMNADGRIPIEIINKILRFEDCIELFDIITKVIIK